MDKHEQIAEQKKRLARLVDHPDWQALRDAFGDTKRAKHKQRIGDMILARDPQTITQREIDYIAGYWDGVNAVLDTPGSAEKTYEEALKRADLLREANLVG